MGDRTFKVIGWSAMVLFFAFLLFFVILMGNAQAEDGYTVMTVTGDHVREREEPNTQCRVTGHYNIGDKVEVIAVQNGWALLRNGYYVSAQYLTTDDVVTKMTMYVIAPGVRERTSTELLNTKNVVCEHQAGETVQVTGPATDGWYQLTNGNFIAEAFLSANYDDIYTHCAAQYKDIVIVSISRQNAVYYYYNLSFMGKVVTGHSTKSPTPTGLYVIHGKKADFDMMDDPNHHVDFAAFFNGNIALHDADRWRHGEYGGDIYIRHGSNGCVNCEHALMEAIYQYSRSKITYVLVIP